jgi:hypothetical protein
MIARMRARRPWWLSFIIGALLLAAAPAVSAQAPADVAGYGPPAWVTPGTRITGYAAGAAVGGSGYQLLEDPEGNYLDPTTGRRYRKTDETGESVGGASGDGLYVIDVIAVEGTDVVVDHTLYGIDRTTNTLLPRPVGGWRQPGGALEGVWVNPEYLATLRTGDIGGLMVLQGPYQLDGTTYDTISVVDPTPGAYASYAYDRVSGLLIASTTRTSGQASPVRLPGQDPPTAADALGISRFVSTRTLELPGIGSRVPDWVAATPGLSYAGVTVITNPLDPSIVVQWPTQASVTFPEVGATWASYQLRTVTVVGGAQNPGGRDGVTSGTGLFWWSPDALATMAPGQVLDTDPVTGLQTTVGARASGGAGPTIDIETRMPGTFGRVTYDIGTGVLLRYQVQTQSDGTTIDLALQGMP